jgi:hypothetical protein
LARVAAGSSRHCCRRVGLAFVASALGVGVAYALPPLLLWFLGDPAALDKVNFCLAPDAVVLGYAVPWPARPRSHLALRPRST